MILRILYFLLFLVSGLIFPWWLTLVVGLLGIVFFPPYFEALFLGVFFDAFYGGGGLTFLPGIPFSFPFFYSSSFLLCFILVTLLQRKLQLF